MSARELLTLNHPIHAVALVVGWVTIAIWICVAFYFSLVGAVHQIQRGVRWLRDRVTEWWRDDTPPRVRFPFRAP